jgi:hypothetical protein
MMKPGGQLAVGLHVPNSTGVRPMYHVIVRRIVRKLFEALGRGDID